jgi:predicted RNA-binding protein with PUA-like domain
LGLNKDAKPKAKPALGAWLMKSEPDVYSIETLKKNKTTLWEGVRNYQARNYMMNDMKVGDPVLFYHSSCEVPGVVGIATISKIATPDPTQFDKKSEYYDPKATPAKPIWFCTEVAFVTDFQKVVSLEQIKADKKLAQMMVLQKGSRLSIQPVAPKDFEHINKLGLK